jgi:methyltransferase (TIGR00027 family)
MKEDQPSLTAQHVAMQRAAHQLLDDPRVLDDPVALEIIGKEAAAQLAADPRRLDPSPFSSYLRAYLVARSKLAEEELADAVSRGVRQYVILGAGLDTFAYRNPYPKGTLSIYEVDHPSTQVFKRARLAEADIALPAGLTFVPVNFETHSLTDGLAATRCDWRAPVFFSWLGVTQYLTAELVMASLGFVATFPAGSGIVFDYTISPSLMTPLQKTALDAIAGRTAAAGEPWLGFFEPEALTADLGAMGFGDVRDVGPDEINARYFANRTDGLKVGSISHVMCARV